MSSAPRRGRTCPARRACARSGWGRARRPGRPPAPRAGRQGPACRRGDQSPCEERGARCAPPCQRGALGRRGSIAAGSAAAVDHDGPPPGRVRAGSVGCSPADHHGRRNGRRQVPSERHPQRPRSRYPTSVRRRRKRRDPAAYGYVQTWNGASAAPTAPAGSASWEGDPMSRYIVVHPVAFKDADLEALRDRRGELPSTCVWRNSLVADGARLTFCEWESPDERLLHEISRRSACRTPGSTRSGCSSR